jgi:hypothetical protein
MKALAAAQKAQSTSQQQGNDDGEKQENDDSEQQGNDDGGQFMSFFLPFIKFKV